MDYPVKTSEQLRQQLRSLRKRSKLTQTDLGALIGVTQARVVEIEANPTAVSLQQIMQVLSALGASLVMRDDRVDPAAAKPDAATLNIVGHAPTVKVKRGSW
jgi:HTH-type transcriptional regulator / antitoxin HipB